MISKFKTFLKALKGLKEIAFINYKKIPRLKPTKRNEEIVVSLTSYGRRVSNSVYYTIISILKQTIQPDKIILWLDNSWNDELIPNRLMSLTSLGLEICYCKDIKSYKKLIPTLKRFQDAIIITIDDDVYYSPQLIECLLNGYHKNGNIQCTEARIPKKLESAFTSYNEWERATETNDSIIPIGVGGVLYPPASLSNEVSNVDFMELAPQADDLWFWIMAKRNNTRHSLVSLKDNYLPFDSIYQFFHKGSALTHSNKGQDQNDIQLNQILSKYPLPPVTS